MKVIVKKLFLFCFVFLLFLTPVIAEGDENGQDSANENTVTIQMVEDELLRISSESSNKEELYTKCYESTVLTEDMKAVYCKVPASNSNQLFDIVLDYNAEAREGEKGKRFYNTLWNSTQTANYISWDMFDWGSSIVTVVSAMILNLIETLGGIVTVIVLFIVNISTTQIVAEVLRDLFGQLYTFIFGGYENTIVLVSLIYLIGLVRIFIERPENLKNIHVIIGVLKQATLSFLFLLAIAIPGKEIFYTIDGWVDKAVVQISNEYFSDSSEFEANTTGTILKAKIYYTMAEQPFMIRHYGVLSEEAIATKFGIDTGQATARYEKLLYDPSRANAKNEMKNLGNKVIPNDMLTMAIAMLSSLFMLVHKILIGIVFSGFSFLLLFASTFKEVLLGLSFMAIFNFALSRDSSAGKIIGNRITWIFALGLLPFFVNLSLQLIIEMITMFGNVNFMFIFVADIILVVSVMIGWANRDKIIRTLTSLKEPFTGMLNGTYSLAQGFSDFRNMVNPSDYDKSYSDSANSSASSNVGGSNANLNSTLDKINQNDLSEEKSIKNDIDNHDSLAEEGEVPNLEELSGDIEKTRLNGQEQTKVQDVINETKESSIVDNSKITKNSEVDNQEAQMTENNALKGVDNMNESGDSGLAEEMDNNLLSKDNTEALSKILNNSSSINSNSDMSEDQSKDGTSLLSKDLIVDENSQKEDTSKKTETENLAELQQELSQDNFELNTKNNGYRNTSNEDLFDISEIKSIEEES